MPRKLPKYCRGYTDVRGGLRHYLRRPGFPQVPLPGLPWSAEFMKEYAAHMTPTEGETVQPTIDGVLPRSLRALAIAYYQSAAFAALKPITQGVYRNIIDAFCKTKDANGNSYADKPAGDVGKGTIKRKQIEDLMQMRADKPDSANGLRKVLREMMKCAVALEWRADDPTQGVKKIPPLKKGGLHRWTNDEVAKFEKHFPIGTKARLAMTLGLYTGQARQDVIAMGEQHIGIETDEEGEDYEALHWVRLKTENSTGLELTIPVHPDLRAVIDATPSGHLMFIVTEFNKPFTAAGFGNWFRDRCNEAGLPQCSFHGLRKASATRLIDAGCDVVEAASITGHATLKELQRYIEERDRKKAARRGMSKLISGTKSANGKIRLATSREKP
jgi:integrase